MRRALLVAALLWVLPTLPSYADPIRITGGSLDIPNPELSGGPLGILNIEGFDGFRLSAIGEAVGFGRCVPCEPGNFVSLGGFLNDSFVVALEGVPLPLNAWRLDSGFNFRFLSDSVVVPPLGTSGVLSAPFEFTSSLRFLNPDLAGWPPQLSFELFGRGTGTVELRPNPFGTPVWEFARARYEFAPVPEPTTLLLVSSGLAAVALRRGRRRTPGP